MPLTQRILIAEDNAAAAKHLSQLLQVGSTLFVDTVRNGREALDALNARPYSVVVTDLNMPHVSGMQLIEAVQKQRLPVSVIVTTGFGTIDQAVLAMRLGATDFLTKPIDIEHLRLVIARALRERSLETEVTALREQLHQRYLFHQILSKSPKMHAVFELINHVAKSSTTVLIEGETGSGKEMVARAVHEASAERTGPFVAINCAAVPETLLESELFGHEKGAFTSAVGQRKGRFELAHGGTLFLDEIGDVPAAMQAKLLRVLQERRFERVGGSEPIDVDVRVITATNRSLQRMVEDGTFREDLYYRLNVVRIELPPLRERAEDIPLLVAHFVQKHTPPGTTAKPISPEAMEVLIRYRWPGNVRELENAIERTCVTLQGEIICPANLPREIVNPSAANRRRRIDLSRSLGEQLQEVTGAFEMRYLRRALRKARGDVGRASRIAGLSRKEFHQKVNRYKIDQTAYRPQK